MIWYFRVSLTTMMYDMISQNGCTGYYLAITERGTNNVVFTKLFMDSDSKYINEINPNFREESDRAKYEDYYDQMRIGTFMKNKGYTVWEYIAILLDVLSCSLLMGRLYSYHVLITIKVCYSW